jgi:hypothetical protein
MRTCSVHRCCVDTCYPVVISLYTCACYTQHARMGWCFHASISGTHIYLFTFFHHSLSVRIYLDRSYPINSCPNALATNTQTPALPPHARRLYAKLEVVIMTDTVVNSARGRIAKELPCEDRYPHATSNFQQSAQLYIKYRLNAHTSAFSREQTTAHS